jgi:hypothetical protein
VFETLSKAPERIKNQLLFLLVDKVSRLASLKHGCPFVISLRTIRLKRTCRGIGYLFVSLVSPSTMHAILASQKLVVLPNTNLCRSKVRELMQWSNARQGWRMESWRFPRINQEDQSWVWLAYEVRREIWQSSSATVNDPYKQCGNHGFDTAMWCLLTYETNDESPPLAIREFGGPRPWKASVAFWGMSLSWWRAWI